MTNEFTTIDANDLDNVTGGAGKGQAIKTGAKWLWNNVAKPVGIGAAWDWATSKLPGGNQQQQAPAPAPAQQEGQ